MDGNVLSTFTSRFSSPQTRSQHTNSHFSSPLTGNQQSYWWSHGRPTAFHNTFVILCIACSQTGRLRLPTPLIPIILLSHDRMFHCKQKGKGCFISPKCSSFSDVHLSLVHDDLFHFDQLLPSESELRKSVLGFIFVAICHTCFR